MKKKLIIIFTTLAILIFTSIVIGASVKIEYNYNLKVLTPSFTISDGKISYSISNNKTSENQSIYEIDTDNSYVDILSPSDEEYTVSTHQKLSEASPKSTDKIFANTIKYKNKTNESDTFTVTYHNEYVTSMNDLKYINYSKFYNNIFNYSKNTNNLALRIITTKAFEIDEELTISAPLSLTILKDLTLSANLNIINSYAGNYDVTKDDSASITSSNLSKIIVSSENSNYKTNVSDTLITNSSITKDNAKAFIESYIPSYIVESIYLPKRYLSSSITYEYYIVDKSGDTEELVPFSGILEEVKNYITDNKLTLRVEITKGKDTDTLDKEIICGNGIDSLKLILENELSSSKNLVNYDLLYLLNSLDIESDLTFKNGTGFDVIINSNVISSDTTITYNSEDSSYYLGDTKVNKIEFRRVSLTSTTFTLNINSTDISINLASASKDEIIEYINSYLHAYIVTNNNIPYDILNIKDNTLYLGTTTLSINTTNLFNSISFKILDTNDNEVANSYTLDSSTQAINVSTNINFDKMYLVYYDTVNSKQVELFRVIIKKSLNSNAGEDTGFESNNPFDSIFSSSTNWLQNNSFTLPSEYSGYYAKITINKIGGVAYDINHNESLQVRGTTYTSKTHNMIAISNSGDTASNNSTYAKTINFNIDYNYIPYSDTIIEVSCELYNNDAQEVTATHIYTFTIPGILKVGENNASSNYTPYVFTSDTLYNDIVSYLVNNNYSSYYKSIEGTDKTYIVSNAKYLAELSIEGKSEEVSLDGIEYFTNTNKIKINNYTVTNMNAFNYLSDNKLKELVLNNDSITKDILSTNIYHLRLNSLSLLGNDFRSVTSFKGLFFRTITELNLNSSKLTTIKGVDSVVSLKVLHIESNNIPNFETLKNLENLTDVYLYNNVLNNDNNYYGTDGLVNECVYYWVLRTSGTVVHMGLNDTKNYTLRDNETKQLDYVNAVVVPTRISSSEKDTLTESLKTNGFNIVVFENGKLIISYTVDDNTIYREFYYEVI